ncbi:MAG: hypothetical protein HGB03_01315 [Candidatus Yonathbacteria bacterium]|nr:hypothetical protein [Candidatus Yonathbacteria bacterium]NTW47903.1 hypothetical protein [Candidatus Yonathbacteria bacterium]
MEKIVAFFAGLEPVYWWMMFSALAVGNAMYMDVFSLRGLRKGDFLAVYSAFLGGAVMIITALGAGSIPFLRSILHLMGILHVEVFYMVCALTVIMGLLTPLMLSSLHKQHKQKGLKESVPADPL